MSLWNERENRKCLRDVNFASDRTEDRIGEPNENFDMNARKYLDRVAGRLLPKLTAERRIKMVAGPLFTSL